MMGFRGENNQLLGITPTVMVVPPALETAAPDVLNAERNDAGVTNVWKGTAELIASPYLEARARGGPRGDLRPGTPPAGGRFCDRSSWS